MKCFLDSEVEAMQLAATRYRKLANAVLHPELLDHGDVLRVTGPLTPENLNAVVDLLPDPAPAVFSPASQA